MLCILHPACISHIPTCTQLFSCTPTSPSNIPASPAVVGPHSRRLAHPPGSWVFPEVQTSVGHEGEKKRKVSSSGVIELCPPAPKQHAFPISKAKAYTQDGIVSMISDMVRAFSPAMFPALSFSPSTHTHNLL